MGRRETYIDSTTGERVEILFCEGMNEPVELSRRPAVDTDTKILPEPQSRLVCYLRDIEFMCDVCDENIATVVVGKRAKVCSPCLKRDPSLAQSLERKRVEGIESTLKRYGYQGE
jgi:hypothetical protein